MVERVQLEILIEKIRTLSASEMRDVAKFGKVKGYSKHYLDLKENLRTMAASAKAMYGVDFEADITAITPITFRGMIPNDVFIAERDQLVTVGEALAGKLTEYAQHQKIVSLSQKTEPTIMQPPRSSMSPPSTPSTMPVTASPLSAPASRLSGSVGMRSRPRRIYFSSTFTTQTTADLKRCLMTADCRPFPDEGVDLLNTSYEPLRASREMKSCEGAVICLVAPDPVAKPSRPGGLPQVAQLAVAPGATSPAVSVEIDGGKPTGTLSQNIGYGDPKLVASNTHPRELMDEATKALAIQNAMTDLGIALSLFPNWVFFAVQNVLEKDLPASYQNFISFRTTGDQLSFDDGQAVVEVFKRANRDNR
ncbi:MAG: hypothetical protein AAFW47_01615 [Pseudomonadota bacterium]